VWLLPELQEDSEDLIILLMNERAMTGIKMASTFSPIFSIKAE
jgi:hypothetical protein